MDKIVKPKRKCTALNIGFFIFYFFIFTSGIEVKILTNITYKLRNFKTTKTDNFVFLIASGLCFVSDKSL